MSACDRPNAAVEVTERELVDRGEVLFNRIVAGNDDHEALCALCDEFAEIKEAVGGEEAWDRLFEQRRWWRWMEKDRRWNRIIAYGYMASGIFGVSVSLIVRFDMTGFVGCLVVGVLGWASWRKNQAQPQPV